MAFTIRRVRLRSVIRQLRILTVFVRRVLKVEMDTLSQLRNEWMIRKVADYEAEKQKIANIFERLNDARVRFQVSASRCLRWSAADMKLDRLGWRSASGRRCRPFSRMSMMYTSH